MERRTALKGMLAAASGLMLPSSVFAQGPQQLFGWRDDPDSLADFVRRHEHPFITQQNASIKGSGKGKKAFLHLAMEKAMARKYRPHDQGAPDCVSQAAALGVDVLSALQIVTQRLPQRWVAKTATETIYGGSRVEIGRYRGRKGGSTGHWAVEWLSKFGTHLRQPYPGGYNFTKYSAQKAVKYGRSGCPNPLEPIAKLHPVKKTAICRSYSDLRDCLYNGHPVMVCSNVGFGSPGRCRRDREGFLTRKRDPWHHSMLFAGYDDTGKRPGALCFNSWGYDWVSGPTRGPQPGSTFWIDASTVTSMLRQGDSFAFSAYVGYPRVVLPNYILH